MLYIALGALGSLVINLFNSIFVKRVPLLKPLVWAVGSSLLTYAVIMVSISPEKMTLPLWIGWLGWPLMAASLAILAYSLFINLPFYRTYITGGADEKLVTGGLYALVRHPWLPPFCFFLVSLIAVSQSRLLLAAVPVWILLNIILVVIQDRFVYPKVFNGYGQYRRQTPMLLPSRKSIAAFINYRGGRE